MSNRKFVFVFTVILFSLLLLQALLSADDKPIAEGTLFPYLTFKNNLSVKERTYLGISRKNNFLFNDIRGSLFVIEVFSTYCTSCPRNIPIMNKVYSFVESDRKLKDRVKITGIAVGNTPNEVRGYKKTYKVLYPILTDYSFAAHKSLGNPRVPFTIFVKRDVKGKLWVVSTHMGLFESPDSVFKTIRSFVY